MHKWQCTITKALLSYLKITQEARKYSISNHIMFPCYEIKYNLSHNVGYSYSKPDLDMLYIGPFISNRLVVNTKKKWMSNWIWYIIEILQYLYVLKYGKILLIHLIWDMFRTTQIDMSLLKSGSFYINVNHVWNMIICDLLHFDLRHINRLSAGMYHNIKFQSIFKSIVLCTINIARFSL